MNRSKLLAAVAVLAMVFAAFAVVSIGDESDAAKDEQKYSTKGLNTTQTFPAGTNIVIFEDSKITTNGKLIVRGDFRVAEGVTLTIEKGGIVIVDGGLVNIEGTVKVTGTDSELAVTDKKPTGSATLYKDYGTVIGGSVIVESGAKISAYTEYNEGSLTGTGSQSILLKKNANLDIKSSSSSKVSSIKGIGVEVESGATFHFQGESENNFTVKAYKPATVDEYYTVSSATVTATKPKVCPDLTFTAESKNVTAYKYDTDEAVSQMFKTYGLNIEGKITNASVEFDGEFKAAKTDDTAENTTYFNTSELAETYGKRTDAYTKASYAFDALLSPMAKITDLVMKEDGNLTIKNGLLMTLTGTMDVVDTTPTSGTETTKIIIDGILVISGTLNASGDEALGTSGGFVAINGGTATVKKYGSSIPQIQIYGAYYIDDSGTDDVLYVSDLKTAIDNAKTAGIETVTLYAVAYSEMTANKGFGGYVIDSDLEIPAGMKVEINNAVIIEEGVTLTVSTGAEIVFGSTANAYIGETTAIYVEGKIVDNDTLSGDEDRMSFQVKIANDDETVLTYTSFETAIKEVSTGTIYLYGNVDIKNTVTIKDGITVRYADGKDGIMTVTEKGTLVIDGVLMIENSVTEKLIIDKDGKVTVNNMIILETAYGEKEIAGAYFTATLDDEIGSANYITSPAVAAENSALIDGTVIELFGTLSFGDITFTQGTDMGKLSIVIDSSTGSTTGNITIVGEGSVSATDAEYTGSVKADVTAGASSVSFVKSNDFVVSVENNETAEAVESRLCLKSGLDGADAAFVEGTITIDGTVYVLAELNAAKIAVTSGSELVIGAEVSTTVNPDFKTNTIAKKLPLITDSLLTGMAGFVVDGKVTVKEGGSVMNEASVINGELVTEESAVTISIGYALVTGTIDAVDTTSVSGCAVLEGKIVGDFTGIVVAKTGSDVSAAVINPNASTGESDAEITKYIVNGADFATVYGYETASVDFILLFLDVPGYVTGSAEIYNDATMNEAISGITTGLATAVSGMDVSSPQKMEESITEIISAMNESVQIGDYPEVYVSLDAALIEGKISAVTGMKFYIDGLDISNFWNADKNVYELAVGEHTVTVQVQPGYTATPEITLNGVEVTDGKLTITGDMKEFTLLASGTITVDGGSSSSDDGMGITDYLLIILVVMVVILAIVVIMRMMRS